MFLLARRADHRSLRNLYAYSWRKLWSGDQEFREPTLVARTVVMMIKGLPSNDPLVSRETTRPVLTPRLQVQVTHSEDAAGHAPSVYRPHSAVN